MTDGFTSPDHDAATGNGSHGPRPAAGDGFEYRWNRGSDGGENFPAFGRWSLMVETGMLVHIIMSFKKCSTLIVFVAISYLGTNWIQAANLSPELLRCEHADNLLGMDAAQPRLGWQITSTGSNILQSAYRVVVATTAPQAAFGRGDVWDSGKISSANSVNVPYAGPVLASARRYFWSVKVWDNQGHVSDWAKPAWWEMGLLAAKDWSGAQWIAEADAPSAPLLRVGFVVNKTIARARLSISAGGYYVASLNGRRVDDAVLDPCFTAYNQRILYATYDVTRQLQRGSNVLGATLGRGFYALDTSTKILWWSGVPWLSREPKLLARLDITYTDHTHAAVVSGPDWKIHAGPTTSDSLYRGETYDARLALPGWDTSGFDASGWTNASVVAAPTTRLHAQMAEPIRVVNTAKAVRITQPQPGIYVYQFPVMLAGWARLTVAGSVGTKVVLRLGEKLNADGTVNNLGDPGLTPGEIQRYEYTLAGHGPEVWEPQYSYAGFQYVQVENFPGTPDANSVVACEVHSDVPLIGHFSSSNPLLNQIHAICKQAVLNNLHSLPTDTPTYEKRGWTADALLFSAQAADNFGMENFFEKWLDDLADTQTAAGEVADIAPSPGGSLDPSWTSAFVVIPWRLHEEYGDREVIAAHYDQMKRYVNYLSARAANHLVKGFYGDWVAPGFVHPPEGPDLVASANYYRDVWLLSKMAGQLGHATDEAAYARLAGEIKHEFNAVYLDAATGIYRTGKEAGYRQTSSAVPLAFGLVPTEKIAAVVSNLVADVRQHDNHLNTGCFGTAALLPALTENGQVNLAYAIATQTTYPSWGNWIAHGATTTWEQWATDDSVRSHDHAFLGTVDDWLFKYLAGIQPAAPGYQEINIHPFLPDGLNHVSASIKTPFGLVASSWTRVADDAIELTVEIPPNTTATVWVPGETLPSHVGSGRHVFQEATVK
jgi:alpha-L-rhamnosidase